MPSDPTAELNAALDCLNDQPEFDAVRNYEGLHLIFLVPLEHMHTVSRFIRTTYGKQFRDPSPACAQTIADTCFRGCFDKCEDREGKARELHGSLSRYIAARI